MDILIMETINQFHSSFLDSLMIFITKLGDMGFIWFVIGLVYLINGKKRIFFGILLCLLFSVLLTEVILKPIVMRPRPFMYNENLLSLIEEPTSSSFPSGHALSSMACATYLFKNKLSGYLYIILGLLISFSRIYVNVHHPSDVLVGAIIGILVGLTIKYFMNRKTNKIHQSN